MYGHPRPRLFKRGPTYRDSFDLNRGGLSRTFGTQFVAQREEREEGEAEIRVRESFGQFRGFVTTPDC